MNFKNKYRPRKLLLSNWLLFCYVFIGVFAPLLANEKPLLITINSKTFFPAFTGNPYSNLPDSTGKFVKTLSNNIDWKKIKAETKIFPPVSWSPLKSDLTNSFVSPLDEQYFQNNNNNEKLPFRYRHFLGTGKTGNDVLASLIHGCRTSLLIGFCSTLIAILIGICLGGMAGYFGDEQLKIKRGSFLLSIILILPSWFYTFFLRQEILKNSFSLSMLFGMFQLTISIILFLCLILWPLLLRFSFSAFLQKKITIPVDGLISRTLEIFLSLPRLILILTLAAITKPSVGSLILIIGLTSWTETARMVRAQFLSLREMNYIAAAKAVGNSNFRILFIHLLPNAISQVIVLGIFGMASAILMETGLSFLGAGVPAETPTWGSLMFQARENYQAWWLVIFSGAAIFFLLISLNSLGKRIKQLKKSAVLFNKL